MGLFAKEKDVFLKIVNSILIVGTIISVIIAIATGIKLINKERIISYDEYAKSVCVIDKLEYECTDNECIKELDIERKKTCTKYYLEDKKEKEYINKINKENFLISLISSLVLFGIMNILNRRYK